MCLALKTQIKSSLTIDLGTTNTKVTLWDAEGPHLKKFKTPKIIDGNLVDFDLKKLWSEIIKTISLFKSIALKQVEKISISGFGESGVLLNASDHRIASECIAWFDERSQSIVDSITESDKQKIYSITGLPVHSHYSACKIAWLIKNNKSLTFPSHHEYIWLCVPDYLIFKLTGKLGTEYSLASRTLCLGLSTKDWSESVKEIMHIQNVSFPKIYQAGEGIGKIIGNLKSVFSPHCVASIAGHDHMVGSNSAKLKENQLLDSTGTTEALMCLVNYPDLSKKAEINSLANGIYTDGQHYTRFTAMPSAGSTIEWFMKLLNLNEDELTKIMHQAMQDYQNNNLDNFEVLVIPHFNGSGAPYKSTESQGLIYGVNRKTTVKEIVFGLFLGLTFEFAIAFESLFDQVALDKIKVIGPAINDPLWLQLKADLIRLPVDSVNIQQAVSAGAHVIATGDSINAKITSYSPTKDKKQIIFIRKKYELYQRIYYFLKRKDL